MPNLKVAFFQKVRFVFQISKSSKKIFQKTILNLKFKFPANNTLLLLAGNLNFKLRIVFWNIFFEDLEIWKTHRTFWKKATFTNFWIYRVCNLKGKKYYMGLKEIAKISTLVETTYI